MLIATDPLSLLFIACFLFGFLFFLGIALLGNLGHGHVIGHGTTNHAGAGTHHVSPGGHTGAPHAPHVNTHTVSHAPSHAPAPAHTQGAGQGTQAQQASNQQEAHGLRDSVLSFINPTSIILFLFGFGFFGYVFHNTARLALPFTLVLAALGAMVIAAFLLIALSRVFGESEANTVQDVSDRTGLLGKVSITIQENNIGEILYVSPGGMRKSIAARSVDGRRIERDTEVVVLNYQRGIAEVDTWEHFINEEEKTSFDSSPSHADELARLRVLLEESGPNDTELVVRKDSQKE